MMFGSPSYTQISRIDQRLVQAIRRRSSMSCSRRGSVANFGLEHILQQYGSMNSMPYDCGMTAENRLCKRTENCRQCEE
jgi:hypothetical protein